MQPRRRRRKKKSDIKLKSQFQGREDLAEAVDLSDGQRPFKTPMDGRGALAEEREGRVLVLSECEVYSSSAVKSEG